MAYFLDLFTPETWHAFLNSDRTVTAFPETSRKRAVERIKPGDLLICYLTRVSRWCGVLKVQSKAYIDDKPIFANPDPYIVRLKVQPVVILEPEPAIPIRDKAVWTALSLTNRFEHQSRAWVGFFRVSLNRIADGDGSYLVKLLKEQQEHPQVYPFSKEHKRIIERVDKTRIQGIRASDEESNVATRNNQIEEDPSQSKVSEPNPASYIRESIQYQAKVARIGAEMGFHIWVPKSDKSQVLDLLPPDKHEKFLDRLPLNYDDKTLRTVEQIDVLWLKGRSMSRAFEIEHTTAIYSGLLRMADLLALQPNMDINLHIVAPTDRKVEVLREIGRPAFSRLERGPLYAQCSYLSYDSINRLIEMQHLSYMSDAIIREYQESTAEELTSV